MRRGIKEVDPKTLVTNEREVGGERAPGTWTQQSQENETCASAEGDDRGSILILAVEPQSQ